MKKIIILIIGLFNTFSISAQTLSVDNLRGYWISNQYQNNYNIFYEDSVASIGITGGGLNVYKSKIGFIRENDPYIRHLDSIQNKSNYITVPIFLRVNLSEDDIKKIELDKFMYENSMFYFDGILCALEFSEIPIVAGTHLEIINSNIHSYTKVDTLPFVFTKTLIEKYFNTDKSFLMKVLGKNFKKIKNSKVYIQDDGFQKSKSYLLKGDLVEVISDVNERIKIKYYLTKKGRFTDKIIEGWIKKSDVE